MALSGLMTSHHLQPVTSGRPYRLGERPCAGLGCSCVLTWLWAVPACWLGRGLCLRADLAVGCACVLTWLWAVPAYW